MGAAEAGRYAAERLSWGKAFLAAGVMAGGRAKRFHLLDKTLYPLGGSPLVHRVINALRAAELFSAVVVVASRRNAEALVEQGIEVIVDNLEMGPLGGLYLLLRMFNRVFVVAADMPLITARNVRSFVFCCLRTEGVVACMPVRAPHGIPEPLYAVYTREALPLLERCIAEGELSIANCLRGGPVALISASEALRNPERELYNVNRYDDLALIVEELARLH